MCFRPAGNINYCMAKITRQNIACTRHVWHVSLQVSVLQVLLTRLRHDIIGSFEHTAVLDFVAYIQSLAVTCWISAAGL